MPDCSSSVVSSASWQMIQVSYSMSVLYVTFEILSRDKKDTRLECPCRFFAPENPTAYRENKKRCFDCETFPIFVRWNAFPPIPTIPTNRENEISRLNVKHFIVPRKSFHV